MVEPLRSPVRVPRPAPSGRSRSRADREVSVLPADAASAQSGQAAQSAEQAQPVEPAAGTPGKRSRLLDQIARFVAVGAGCTLLDYGSYIALGVVLGWPYWLAKTIAFCLGTIASYLGNRRFTFRAGKRGPRAEVGGFVVLYGATFAANLGCNQLLLQITGTGAGEFWPATLIWIVAQTTGTVINFVLLRTFVFPERS